MYYFFCLCWRVTVIKSGLWLFKNISYTCKWGNYINIVNFPPIQIWMFFHILHVHVYLNYFSGKDLNNFYYSLMRIIPDCEIGTCVWYFQYELRVLEEFASQMSKLMPVKQEVDMSSLIMAPMPGVLKSVAVKPGDMVRGATVRRGGGGSYTCIGRDEYFFNSFKWRKGFDQFAFVHIKTIVNQLFYGNKKILWDFMRILTIGNIFHCELFLF